VLEHFKKYILPVLDTLSRIDTSLQILSFFGLDWKSWAIMLGTVVYNFYQAPMTPAQSGITIAGTFILACVAILGIEYRRRHCTHPKPKIAEPHAFREASARLRTAFTPALAFLDKARRHGSDHERPDASTFLRGAFESHAAAIEEFRHFVHPENREAYQKAWNEFCALTYDDGVDAVFMASGINDRDPWSVIEDKIRVILSFSNEDSIGSRDTEKPSPSTPVPEISFLHDGIIIKAPAGNYSNAPYTNVGWNQENEKVNVKLSLPPDSPSSLSKGKVISSESPNTTFDPVHGIRTKPENQLEAQNQRLEEIREQILLVLKDDLPPLLTSYVAARLKIDRTTTLYHLHELSKANWIEHFPPGIMNDVYEDAWHIAQKGREYLVRNRLLK
jgi:hypothetical protein